MWDSQEGTWSSAGGQGPQPERGRAAHPGQRKPAQLLCPGWPVGEEGHTARRPAAPPSPRSSEDSQQLGAGLESWAVW